MEQKIFLQNQTTPESKPGVSPTQEEEARGGKILKESETQAISPSELKFLKDLEKKGIKKETLQEAWETQEKLKRDQEKQKEKDTLLTDALLEKIKGGEEKKEARTLETPMIGDENADVKGFQTEFLEKDFSKLMGKKFHEEIQELMASASPTTVRRVADRFNNPFSYKGLDDLGTIEGITNNKDDAGRLSGWLKDPESIPAKKEKKP